MLYLRTCANDYLERKPIQLRNIIDNQPTIVHNNLGYIYINICTYILMIIKIYKVAYILCL